MGTEGREPLPAKVCLVRGRAAWRGWSGKFLPGARSSGNGREGGAKSAPTRAYFSPVVTSQMNLSGSLLFFPVVSEERYILIYSFSKHGVFKELQIMHSD